MQSRLVTGVLAIALAFAPAAAVAADAVKAPKPAAEAELEGSELGGRVSPLIYIPVALAIALFIYMVSDNEDQPTSP